MELYVYFCVVANRKHPYNVPNRRLQEYLKKKIGMGLPSMHSPLFVLRTKGTQILLINLLKYTELSVSIVINYNLLIYLLNDPSEFVSP